MADAIVESDPDELKVIGDRRDSRDSRVSGQGAGAGLGEAVFAYLTGYVYMPQQTAVVVTAWVMSSWLADLWDRFPHLGITSIQKECGKTRLLELLLQVCRNAELNVNLSSASMFRSIETDRPTLLHDEAQGLIRAGSESSQVLYDLFCGAITKDATVKRCVGQDHTPKKFPSYCPKAVALIGGLTGPLADRCLPILLKRKTKSEQVRRARMRDIEKEGKLLHEKLDAWAADESVRELAKQSYADLEPFDISDRMAELFLPLQAVLMVESPGLIDDLSAFALGLENYKREVEMADPGLRLLERLPRHLREGMHIHRDGGIDRSAGAEGRRGMVGVQPRSPHQQRKARQPVETLRYQTEQEQESVGPRVSPG